MLYIFLITFTYKVLFILKKILIIDDDTDLLVNMKILLENFFYSVSTASSKNEIMLNINKKYDVVITDIMMPNIDGYRVFELIKSSNPDTPIIFHSAIDSGIDEVKSLEIGANDYIRKPCHPRVMLARIKKVLNNKTSVLSEKSQECKIYKFNGWYVNVDKQEVIDPCNRHITLTTACFDLLLLFLNNSNKIITRNQIMDEIYRNNYESNYRNIDNFIYKLRKNIKIDGKSIFKTIHGKGYMLALDVVKCWE